MKSRKKTWREKLDSGKAPEVVTMNRMVQGIPAGGKMLIPTPRQVDTYIRGIPSGESRTTKDMSLDLGRQANADLACPLCCGIFLRISAEAAHEELAAGKATDEVTPFWRMIPPKAPIRKKIAFVALVDDLRAAEGL